MIFTTGRTDLGDVHARLENAFQRVDDCAERFVLQSNAAFSARIFFIFVRVCSTKRKGAVFKPSVADSKQMSIALESASSAALDIASFTLFVCIWSSSSWTLCRIIARSLAPLKSLDVDPGVAGV